MFVVRYLVVLVSLFVSNEGSRILAVFPTPSISHQVVFRPLILELLNRGHEVVLLATDPMYKKGSTPANLTQIDVHDKSYAIFKKIMLTRDLITGSTYDLFKQGARANEAMTAVFKYQLETDQMQEILKDKTRTFDLLLLEAYLAPALGLSHIFKAPVILISSFIPTPMNLVTAGASLHPFLYPMCFQQKFTNPKFSEKLFDGLIHSMIDTLTDYTDETMMSPLKPLFGENVPSLKELRNNVDLLFLNIHNSWDSNRPVPPNVIYLGGLHQIEVKELPQDLKSYLDSSKNGVIYISFGTNVEPSFLPPEKIQVLVKVFSKLPYDVLWKWNNDELPGRTENIKISKWLPQSDLLRHPKIKLFITQGGLQSTEEAISAGVPLIGIPLLGDQWYNVEMYVKHKIGLRLDLATFTEEQFETAIKTIVNDKSYRENIVNLRTTMRDQPHTALERAVWWTEYVLRHKGAKHLRAPAANMSWPEYYEIGLLFYLLLIVLAVGIIVSLLLYYLFGLISMFKVNNGMKAKQN